MALRLSDSFDDGMARRQRVLKLDPQQIFDYHYHQQLEAFGDIDLLHSSRESPRRVIYVSSHFKKKHLLSVIVKYRIADYDTFWQNYVKLPQGEKHFYEVIRTEEPRKLYFDIEFVKTLNVGKDEAETMTSFYAFLFEFLNRHFAVDAERKEFLELDSSSETKFSRHVIWCGDNKIVFQNYDTVKAFMDNFLKELEMKRNEE